MGCLMAAGPTMVSLADPAHLGPRGIRTNIGDPAQPDESGMSLGLPRISTQEDGPIVRFVSGPLDAVGYHTAIRLSKYKAVFPPMTLFSVVRVQLKRFEYDGTADLMRTCMEMYGSAPAPEPCASAGGRLHISREQLVAWLAKVGGPKEKALLTSKVKILLKKMDVAMFINDDGVTPKRHPSGDRKHKVRGDRKHQEAIDWLQEHFLSPDKESPMFIASGDMDWSRVRGFKNDQGRWNLCESSIYTVEQHLVTVQATFLPLSFSTKTTNFDSTSGGAGAAPGKLTANSSDLK